MQLMAIQSDYLAPMPASCTSAQTRFFNRERIVHLLKSTTAITLIATGILASTAFASTVPISFLLTASAITIINLTLLPFALNQSNQWLMKTVLAIVFISTGCLLLGGSAAWFASLAPAFIQLAAAYSIKMTIWKGFLLTALIGYTLPFSTQLLQKGYEVITDGNWKQRLDFLQHHYRQEEHQLPTVSVWPHDYLHSLFNTSLVVAALAYPSAFHSHCPQLISTPSLSVASLAGMITHNNNQPPPVVQNPEEDQRTWRDRVYRTLGEIHDTPPRLFIVTKVILSIFYKMVTLALIIAPLVIFPEFAAFGFSFGCAYYALRRMNVIAPPPEKDILTNFYTLVERRLFTSFAQKNMENFLHSSWLGRVRQMNFELFITLLYVNALVMNPIKNGGTGGIIQGFTVASEINNIIPHS